MATHLGNLLFVKNKVIYSEQVVILHKFLLGFKDHDRQHIDIRGDVKRYVWHINLDIIEDGVFCEKVARQYYLPQLGARSLLGALDRIEDKLMEKYKNTDKVVTEKTND